MELTDKEMVSNRSRQDRLRYSHKIWGRKPNIYKCGWFSSLRESTWLRFKAFYWYFDLQSRASSSLQMMSYLCQPLATERVEEVSKWKVQSSAAHRSGDNRGPGAASYLNRMEGVTGQGPRSAGKLCSKPGTERWVERSGEQDSWVHWEKSLFPKRPEECL